MISRRNDVFMSSENTKNDYIYLKSVCWKYPMQTINGNKTLLKIVILFFAGTKLSTEYLCPRGTFSNATGLYEWEQCSPCSAGYYCGIAGSTSPTAMCDAGYFCKEVL